MVFNATFNNISVILWQSVLLVEETSGVLEMVPKEKAHHHKQSRLETEMVRCSLKCYCGFVYVNLQLTKFDMFVGPFQNCVRQPPEQKIPQKNSDYKLNYSLPCSCS
jgi:hypothetical protein